MGGSFEVLQARLDSHRASARRLNRTLLTTTVGGFGLWAWSGWNGIWALAAVGAVAAAAGPLLLGPIIVGRLALQARWRSHVLTRGLADVSRQEPLCLDIEGAARQRAGVAWLVSGLLVTAVGIILLPENILVAGILLAGGAALLVHAGRGLAQGNAMRDQAAMAEQAAWVA